MPPSPRSTRTPTPRLKLPSSASSSPTPSPHPTSSRRSTPKTSTNPATRSSGPPSAQSSATGSSPTTPRSSNSSAPKATRPASTSTTSPSPPPARSPPKTSGTPTSSGTPRSPAAPPQPSPKPSRSSTPRTAHRKSAPRSAPPWTPSTTASKHSGPPADPPHIDEILAGEDDDTYDWVIPGLIEHQERVILTAEEGAGKSTLLRQIGITAASGIHPFSGEQIPPVTVLHIDVENSLRQSRRRYRPLRIQAGDALNPDLLRVELKVAGLDLTQTPDRDWLLQITQSIKPDLLLIGPIYKLANGDPTEEKSAKPVAMILDLEAHVAKAPSGQKKRPHEPYGWSGWLRWPELGIFMDKDGTLKHWRGAREEREWPEKLERGGHWPWSAALTGPDEAWIAIQKARKDAKRPVSLRDLEQMTGFSKSTLGRLVGPTGKYAHGWPGYNNSNLISDRRDGS
jgi:hypothetical protein